MICRNCGRASTDDAKFCSECGTPFTAHTMGDTTKVIPVVPEEVHHHAELDADDAAAVESLPANTALLIVQRGSGAGSRFLLDADVTTIGRHPDSDIFLDDITVSRHHVKFIRRDGRIYVEDQGSLNGTYVNRTLVDGSAPLREGDEVQIGKFRMIFHLGGSGLR